jgi:surface carbohydrate biosynthesis protein
MKQAPKNFILLVEMLERELPASVLLGTELASRGHHVWLIEKGRFRKSPASFAPSIVLEKGLTTGCLPKFRSIRGAGHILTVMCQEGFTYRSGEDYIDRRVFGETLKNVDYLFLWGERQKQDLQGFLSQVRSYHVTGNPRFDLLHPRFEKSWEARKLEILREHGDFVLFTSRFGSANHFRRTLDETVDRRAALYTGDAAESAPERFRYLRRLFENYMSVIGEMAARFPNSKFVVRPHPLEDPEVWKGHFKDTANVSVRDGGSVIPWLSAARCVVHNACTTGIEAYILGRPVIEYHPSAIPRGNLDPLLPGKVTGACDSAEALARWIEVMASSDVTGRRRPASDDLIAFHLHNARQPNAYCEMAAAMDSFRGPRPWSGLLNKMSRKHARKKMQKRYIDLDEVNGLLRSYVTCKVRDQFVPAVVDEVGIKLQ